MSMKLEQKRREQLERSREAALKVYDIYNEDNIVLPRHVFEEITKKNTTDSFNAGALAVIEDIRRKMPSYWVDKKNRLRTIDQDDMTAYVEDHLTTLEAKIKENEL